MNLILVTDIFQTNYQIKFIFFIRTICSPYHLPNYLKSTIFTFQLTVIHLSGHRTTSVTSHVAEEYSGEIGHVLVRSMMATTVLNPCKTPENVIYTNVQVSFNRTKTNYM